MPFGSDDPIGGAGYGGNAAQPPPTQKYFYIKKILFPRRNAPVLPGKYDFRTVSKAPTRFDLRNFPEKHAPSMLPRFLKQRSSGFDAFFAGNAVLFEFAAGFRTDRFGKTTAQLRMA